jgi:hypothetical protein
VGGEIEREQGQPSLAAARLVAVEPEQDEEDEIRRAEVDQGVEIFVGGSPE